MVLVGITCCGIVLALNAGELLIRFCLFHLVCNVFMLNLGVREYERLFNIFRAVVINIVACKRKFSNLRIYKLLFCFFHFFCAWFCDELH